MTALIKGQNIPLTTGRLSLTVEVACPVDVSALLLAADEKVRSSADFVFYNQPLAPGVSLRAGALDIDLDGVPGDIQIVLCVLSVDPDAPAFGSVPAPVTRIGGADGVPLASFEAVDLSSERVVVAVEFYRRNAQWKLRAVGQGHAAGLAALITAHGVEVDDPEPPPALAPVAAAPVEATIAVQPVERLYSQVWAMFEDAARSTAAFRSATSYAEQRRDDELSALLGDPATRNSPGSQLARDQSERRYDDLIRRAAADYQRDVSHLVTEIAAVEPALPASMAAWTSSAWLQWTPPVDYSQGLRVGNLHVEESPELRLPMLVALPLRRPLWIDTSDGGRADAGVLARSLIVRLLTAQPLGTLSVHVADLVGGGAATQALAPLASTGLVAPVAATSPAELAALLTQLVERVDLVQMAARAGALESLEGRIDGGDRLLVLNDFPYGIDDAAIAQVRYLVDEGPAAGVTLLVVADASEAEDRGPLVSSLFRSFLRLPVTGDEHIGDPWVGLSWAYDPDVAAAAANVDIALARLAAARLSS